ncbi:HNH endonuclease [Halorubrum tailed virus 27]|uniref:HNH endonuclease n=1 Tax=Halorubrum tailed virus 27 TaxID=2878008 RepID=A0AAE8XXZ5_9CAUD|nr:HNH endonuclease [Halorubrum tailed virus 27]UBF22742.1 HNH endonuclease [Halorubrum tailed virus 27]
MYWSINSGGYEQVSVLDCGTERTVLIHRLQAIAEWGQDAVVDKHVHHKNECKIDNRVKNLEILSPAEHGRRHNPGHSNDECIEALVSVGEDLGHSPSMLEYKQYDGLPSVGFLISTFGSWNEAKRAAGLETVEQPSKTPEEDCIGALRKAAGLLGDSFTREQYESLNFSPRAATIERRLGGWNAAKDAADLPALNVRQ